MKSDDGLSLVQLHIMVPREIRDRMISLAANNPEEYYSTSEAWIKAAQEYLRNNERVRI